LNAVFDFIDNQEGVTRSGFDKETSADGGSKPVGVITPEVSVSVSATTVSGAVKVI
jgi:hypothetical protein